MKQVILSVVLAGAACALPVRAQFFDSLINPDVKVTLKHAPGLGVKAPRVAFAPVAERASEDLVSACIADLSASGLIEVLDRGNTEKVLKEQKFSNSGLVDEKSAIELGRLLGSGVMLFVKVQRQDVKHIPLSSTQASWVEKNGTYHPAVTTWISKTQVEYNASIQAVDMTTGRIYSQQRVAVAPSREAASTQGRPEFPSDTEVLEMAVGLATARVHQMLLPWTEQRTLIFYDDKDYGMKDAYKRLQLDDAAGALQKSMAALAAAKADPKAKPKYLGRTNYNAAMCNFILGDLEAALPLFKAARETDPSHKIFAKGEADCTQAMKLNEEMAKVDAKTAKIEVALPQAEKAAPAPEPVQEKAKGGEGVEERLKKLEALKKKGLISPQDYKAKKAEIMKDL